jgi:hypothetical protein
MATSRGSGLAGVVRPLKALLGECALVLIEHLVDLVQSQPNVIDGVDVCVVVEGLFRTCKVIAEARQCVALDQYSRKGSTGHPYDGVVPWMTEQLDTDILHGDILAALTTEEVIARARTGARCRRRPRPARPAPRRRGSPGWPLDGGHSSWPLGADWPNVTDQPRSGPAVRVLRSHVHLTYRVRNCCMHSVCAGVGRKLATS